MIEKSLFWADTLADQIMERSKTEKRMPNIKCQQTPSGAKHIGNLNEVIRAYFPYKVLQESGVKATFVHTTDDRDPLKDIPAKLPDLNGNWHETKKLQDMKQYLGKPLCRTPDPFDCCKTWSEHFTTVWMNGIYALGIRPDLHSVNKLYREGKFEPYIKMVFSKRERVGQIVAKFQRTKSKDYIPFDAICPNCGMLSNITYFDLKTKKVGFACGGKEIKKRKSSGCGYEGEAPWNEGKLQWRFEWPALWAIFNTTYEPFGKDHYEGSWKSGVVIAKDIFEIEPPIPYVYEFFLVNGQKMSASVGNVYIVQDMLKILEPEIFLYFYTKKPGKQRDMDLKNINLLVEDFEAAEGVYFSDQTEGREIKNIRRSYEMCMADIPITRPVRIPYSYASMVAQLHGDDKEKIKSALRSTGHLSDTSGEDVERAITRVRLAGNWARLYADDRQRIIIQDDVPDSIISRVSKHKIALNELGSFLGKELNEEELRNVFKKISDKHGVEPKELFQSIYLVLLGKESGPRLAPFILTIGKEKVSRLLKQV